jgi:hypothetical protein
MTRNPYADPMGYEPEPGPARVSALAVSSLVFGILCCIPGVGFIALLLGLAAMVAIGRSDGRLAGKGLATAGLVLGLLGIIWTGLVGMGVLQFGSQVQSLSGTYGYVEQRDYSGFRNALTPAASQQLTDEQIADFHARVERAWGSHQGATRGFGGIWGGYSRVGPQIERMQGSLRLQGEVWPVPMRFDQGSALAFYQLNRSQASTRGQPGIENLVIMDPNGQPIWLIPPAGAGKPPAAPSSPAEQPAGEPGGPAEEPDGDGGGA